MEVQWSRLQSIRFSIYTGTDWVRLNFFLKTERIEYYNLNLNKPITTVQCSNEITINIINKSQKFRGRAGSPSNTKSPGPRPTSIPSGILIHPATWPQQMWDENWGELCPFGGREVDPHLTECGQGWGLPACQVSSRSIQPFGHNTPTLQTGQIGQTADR